MNKTNNARVQVRLHHVTHRTWTTSWFRLRDCTEKVGRTECGGWEVGRGKVYCPKHLRMMERQYPQGWRAYPGDTCHHGKYVGGSGIDWVCGRCEEEREDRRR